MHTDMRQALSDLVRSVLLEDDVDSCQKLSAEGAHGHLVRLALGEFPLEEAIKKAFELPEL